MLAEVRVSNLSSNMSLTQSQSKSRTFEPIVHAADVRMAWLSHDKLQRPINLTPLLQLLSPYLRFAEKQALCCKSALPLHFDR